ncbi:MAG: hypothetical protein ACM3X9_05060 [Bacillota bacterium]
MGNSNSSAKDKESKTEPVKGTPNSSRPGQCRDPYVVKATERAKSKIRDRIFQLNGGHVH